MAELTLGSFTSPLGLPHGIPLPSYLQGQGPLLPGPMPTVRCHGWPQLLHFPLLPPPQGFWLRPPSFPQGT